MRDIADRVGINIATLHYHVPSKEALIGIVAQSMRDQFISQHQNRPRAGLSPVERLRSEFADFRETLAKNPMLFVALAELADRARRDPDVDAAIGPMRTFWHDQIVEILRDGRSDGSFRADIDPSAAALIIAGALNASHRHPQMRLVLFDRVCEELMRAVRNPGSR